MTVRTLIHGGHLVDPSQGLDRPGSLLLEGERIADWDVPIDQAGDATRFDATGCIVSPGWIDIGVELREPGFEEDETIATGAAAALTGGFTMMACLPNTDPPVDSPGIVEFIQLQSQRAAQCQIKVLGCVSKGRTGEQMAELGILARAGSVGFTDAPTAIHNPDLLRRALQYCRMLQRPILNRPEARELSEEGVMHDGLVSTILGLPGLPTAAEDVMTGRDLRLAEATGGWLHLLSISSEGSVDQIRRARDRGAHVTCSVCLPNLLETDESLRSFNPHFKLRPPLRAQHHIEACLQGVRDGTISIITTGHAPRAAEKKMREIDLAPFGAVGLETAIPLVHTRLVATGLLDWLTVVDRFACQPARLIGEVERGTLRRGSIADITLIDPHMEYKVDAKAFRSKSTNSPWLGLTLRGGVRAVFIAGIRR